MVNPTGEPLRWIPVAGGTCLYGDAQRTRPIRDLLVSATVLTYGQLGWSSSDPDLPITGADHAEADRLAVALGGRLPTSAEWEWIASGPARRLYPWGNQPWAPPLAQLSGAGCAPDRPGRVGAHPAGATPEGVHDLAGLVWEWTSSTMLGGGRMLRGGSYASKPLYAQCTFLNGAPAELSSPGIGIRVVKTA
ncbi:hypothetical protein NUM_43120 [Actinocatenispora comari]|uniref:Sulfatase-modifying factor enzyme-like domain-containing protein n=1 Tax=Actinocatenispora comari TaxID=2807577 RepID=A0A8J4AI34_9ACTN|nr:hypothetical protein NUM_43120 [Actinocatenispora comari]